MPKSASWNGRRLESWSCGLWSLATASMVPSASAAAAAARSASLRSGVKILPNTGGRPDIAGQPLKVGASTFRYFPGGSDPGDLRERGIRVEPKIDVTQDAPVETLAAW